MILKPVYLHFYKISSYLKICFSWVIVFVICTIHSFLYGQNVEYVTKEEYEDYYEKPMYVPDARLSGKYNIIYETWKGELLDGQGINNETHHNIEFNIRSETDFNATFNMSLANTVYFFGEGNDFQQQDNTGDNNSFYIKELYFDINPTPRTIIRFGRSHIEIGDRNGMLYTDISDAIAIYCAVGTWCLDLGYAYAGQGENDALSWVQLDYPVYFSSSERKDFWNEKEATPRYDKSLNIELFEVRSHIRNIALARYGGATYNPTTYNGEKIYSPAQAQFQNDEYIFFDMDIKNRGINVVWRHEALNFYANYIRQQGKKKYYTEKTNTILNSMDVSSIAYKLQGNFSFQNGVIFGVEYLSATGNDDTSSDAWVNKNTTFFEIKKGNYGDAIIYFTGYEDTGERHTISNLTYQSLFYGWHTSNKKFDIMLKYYRFFYTSPIYLENGDKVSDIGTEFDVKMSYELYKNTRLYTFFALFRPQNGYSPDDNILPTATTEEPFSKIVFSLGYEF